MKVLALFPPLVLCGALVAGYMPVAVKAGEATGASSHPPCDLADIQTIPSIAKGLTVPQARQW